MRQSLKCFEYFIFVASFTHNEIVYQWKIYCKLVDYPKRYFISSTQLTVSRESIYHYFNINCCKIQWLIYSSGSEILLAAFILYPGLHHCFVSGIIYLLFKFYTLEIQNGHASSPNQSCRANSTANHAQFTRTTQYGKYVYKQKINLGSIHYFVNII